MNKFFNRYKKILLIIAITFICFIIAEYLGFRDRLTPEYIKSLFLQNIIISSLLFVTLFTIGSLIQVPGIVFLAGAVFALGKFNGYLLTYIAAVTSCLIAFKIVNSIGNRELFKLENKFALKLLTNLNKRPFISIFTLRVCFQSLPALNFALAMSGVGFRSYALATMLGLPIPILVHTVFINELIERFGVR